MFDINQDLFKDGEHDERQAGKYMDDLMEAFGASPEAKPLLDSGVGVGWVWNMMDYAINHLGVTAATMSLADFNEILFDLFPRKMSTEAKNAPAIVEELRAFWQFVHREYGIPTAARIAASLDAAAADRLEKKLADPSSWGMAKSMFMMGQQAGFDMTTQEGLDQFMLVYNAQQLLKNDLPLPQRHIVDLHSPFPSLPPMGMPSSEREKRRKEKKRQRQNRKRKHK